jgi:hypothetical protein
MEEELSFLNKHLKGRTITEVQYTSREHADELGWVTFGIVLILDDGKEVLVTQDDEGNGPGTLLF